jgi:hypothetical protein
LNPIIIKKYREVNWIFAIYEGVVLRSIYLLTREQMEFFFSRWEAKRYADGGKDINNPKIPLRYVVEYGVLIFKY